jgi:hypothetical protein
MHTDPTETFSSTNAMEPATGVMDSAFTHNLSACVPPGVISGHSLESMLPELGEQGMLVPLATGTAYFNYYWLRDFCPSTIDPETQERIFEFTESANAPFPKIATVINNCLHIS